MDSINTFYISPMNYPFVLRYLIQHCYWSLTELINLEMWGYCVTCEEGTLECCFDEERLDKVGKVVGDHMIVFATVGEVHLSTFG